MIAHQRFDVSQQQNLVFPLRHHDAKSLIVEFAPDGNGKCSGAVNVYLGGPASTLPYFQISANSMRVYPMPGTEYLTLVPVAGSLGICSASISQENLGIGIFPFSAGGSGGGSTAIAYDSYISTLSGIIAHYPMNEKTGLILNDVANGHNGSYNNSGVTLASSVGPQGNLAPNFDGVRGYAVANIPLVTTGFSCVCWFYNNESLPGNNAAICSNNPDIFNGFMMGYFNSVAGGQYAFSGNRIAAQGSVLGSWHCGIVTWDGVTFRAYLDGGLIGVQPIASVNFTAQTVWSNLQGNCVNCSICRTSFFSRALTISEIAVIMIAV